MIKTVTAKINGQILYLTTTDGVNWLVTSTAPDVSGVYDIEISITDESGVITYDNTANKELAQSLLLYVTNRNRSNIIHYLPEFLRPFTEFNKIYDAEDPEFDYLYPSIESVFAESTIKYCSEERIKEWEQSLKIKPNGTLAQRRLFLLAKLRGQGKLNEAKIAKIVHAFTGGEAITSFENSTLTVKVLPPNNGEIYLFPDIERALNPLIPAHIGLSVRRWYSTWQDIKQNFADWTAVSTSGAWQDVKNYIPPQ